MRIESGAGGDAKIVGGNTNPRAGRSHGVEQRFRECGLDRVFGSLRAFIEATQWQQYHALKYQIEAMRRQPAIAGNINAAMILAAALIEGVTFFALVIIIVQVLFIR